MKLKLLQIAPDALSLHGHLLDRMSSAAMPAHTESNHKGSRLAAFASHGTPVYYPGVPKGFVAIAQQA